ncbi:MAG: thioredoxin-dependent phosophoadenylyl-sulfate reductase [Actinomycetia bacterium]|nr:thioredoxin-dependent phosophoadenylyl-sulfate reductase [Actinomycetes bacterium]
MAHAQLLTDVDLEARSKAFESKPASAAITWAVDTFGDGLVLLASMGDAVLIDVAMKVDPRIEVAFLDTQYHFAETHETVARVEEKYGIKVNVLTPDLPLDDLWKTDTDACCFVRKVKPLDDLLATHTAWLSGLRRADSAARADTPIVSRDRRGVVKINPIANWSDLDVDGYIAEHDVPVNPLVAQGYASVGCWPCTQKVVLGADPRSGRWVGTDKTECGLHL